MKKYCVVAIIPAAGKGKRLNRRCPKALVPLKSMPLFIRTLKMLMGAHRFRRVIVPTDPACVGLMEKQARQYGLEGVEFVKGGRTRAESVRNGLKRLGPEDCFVLIHDMARPFVSPRKIRELIQRARVKGASILALKSTSTLKEVHPRAFVIRRTLNREHIYMAQTPQVFRKDLLVGAYRLRNGRISRFTDEASLVESLRRPVSIVEGSSTNIKITTPEDLRIAEALIEGDLV